MSENIQQQEAQDPVVQQEGQATPPAADTGAQQPDFESMYYQRVEKDFGIQRDAYGNLVERVRKGPEPPRFSSKVGEQLYNVLGDKDEASAREALRDLYLVNGTDWEQAAKEDPSGPLKVLLRIENPTYSDKSIDALYKQKYGSVKLKAEDYYDDEGNPTVDDPEGMASLNRDMMERDLRNALGKINEKKLAFDKVGQDRRQAPDPVETTRRLYDEFTALMKSGASSFKVGDGENTWRPGAKDVEELLSQDAFHSVWEKAFGQDGTVNQGFFAEYLQMKQFLEKGLPAILKAAGGKGVAQAVDNLSNNPHNNGAQTPPNGNPGSFSFPGGRKRTF